LVQFNSPVLRPGIQPSSYLIDTCAYLSLRWGEGKAEPGTVVVPVMFHSIVQSPSKVTDPKDITVEEFQAFVYYAESLGFETITTQELLDFLLFNDPIPPRSMIMIVDDRRPGLIYEHFMPVLEANDWTVTPAYIADPDSLDWAWDWMERMYTSGRLDVQSHGYTGQLYILPDTPLEQIQHEIWDSTPVLEQHFGVRPLAFIWPGGNFTPLAVEVARQGDYQLGFTAYSRGPLLFNWIPLGEEERLMNDPLMVLPRAWSNSVNYNLDEAIRVSEQAAAFAEANAQAEREWMQRYCSGNSAP
jgi:peptidoglycan/xylan/chitin deacetylase (PgdA/CDA1 family)